MNTFAATDSIICLSKSTAPAICRQTLSTSQGLTARTMMSASLTAETLSSEVDIAVMPAYLARVSSDLAVTVTLCFPVPAHPRANAPPILPAPIIVMFISFCFALTNLSILLRITKRILPEDCYLCKSTGVGRGLLVPGNEPSKQ